MRLDLAKQLEILEAKANPRVISTWVDFMMGMDEYEDEGDVEVELCPELHQLRSIIHIQSNLYNI